MANQKFNDMENENLKKQMEELFRLFKKMMEKYPPESMPGIDKTQAEQLKMMLSNYEDMEISFSSDMFGLFDEEMTQKILSKLIKQLKEQLGEDAYDEPVEQISLVDKKEKEFEQLPTEDRYIALLDAIDAELKKPNISMEEIDELLDRRRKIQDNISKQLHS